MQYMFMTLFKKKMGKATKGDFRVAINFFVENYRSFLPLLRFIIILIADNIVKIGPCSTQKIFGHTCARLTIPEGKERLIKKIRLIIIG